LHVCSNAGGSACPPVTLLFCADNLARRAADESKPSQKFNEMIQLQRMRALLQRARSQTMGVATTNLLGVGINNYNQQ